LLSKLWHCIKAFILSCSKPKKLSCLIIR
jgi:hypothetical protein